MRVAGSARDPRVRTYLELRAAVGCIAVGLPVVLLLSSWLLPGAHTLPTSISAYYYSPMRDVLVGSLCAIGFFNLCARGYELRDDIAGVVSAVCALGLAFCPTAPPGGGGPRAQTMSAVHNLFAELFFIILAIMCLALFRTTARNRTLTRAKRRRNAVYTACGSLMAICGVVDFFCHRMRPVPHFGPIGSIFCCELIALEAFGVAWLVKGKTFRRHKRSSPAQPRVMAGV